MITKNRLLKVFISDKLGAGGLNYLNGVDGITVINTPGLKGDDLKRAVADVDAIVIRSGTKVTAEIIDAAKQLKVIGRAGVGVDNVDLNAATRRGIIVMNTPSGNTISTAELTFAMILALSRSVPAACLSLKSGEWKRSAFTGVELYRKILGIVGFGRIGREVAHRAHAFGMRILVYDPFISPDRVKQINVNFVTLDELIAQADFLTVHTPLTPETQDIINADTFTKMKDGVRIINCARGGIINEDALLGALLSGRVAAAALDVYVKEPPANTALLTHPHVVCTPHLGASTTEAQENVAVEVSEQVVDALLGKEIRNSVNMPSLDAESARVLRPWTVLAERLGLLAAQLFEGDITSVNIQYSGEVTGYKLTPLSSAALKGLLAPVCGDSVNFINSAQLATERGMTITEGTTTATEDFANAIQLEITTPRGSNSVIGTLFANKEPRIVRINEYYIDAIPSGMVLAVTNDDKPGFVGEIGSILGKAGINIAEMTLGRTREGHDAFCMINVDGNISTAILDEIAALSKVKSVRLVRF